MASVYKLIAPRQMGQIPEGFELTVYTNCTSCDLRATQEALCRAGFGDADSLSWASSGNWEVIQIQ